MKTKKSVSLLACLFSVWLITGCGDDGGDNGNGNGLAPKSIAGRTITVQVSGGAAPFSSGGSYVLSLGGSPGDTSARYRLDGTGGPQSNTGRYNYDRTGPDTANIRMVEDVNNTVVNNQLQFQSQTSGTIHSTSDRGGFQDGTFQMQ